MSGPHLARDLAPLQPFIRAHERILRSGGKQFTTPFRVALHAAHHGRCTYCGEPLDPATMHVDHVRPLEEGGDDGAENLVAACAYCNCAKGRRSLEALRWSLTVRHSALAGVILPAQAQALTALGIDLKLELFKFRFEEWLEAHA